MIGRVAGEFLPRNWTTVSLKTIVTKLVDGSHNPPSKRESGVPMLSARNILNNQIVFEEYRLISEEDFEREHTRTRISPGDVLLTIVGTIGRSAVVPASAKSFALQRSVAVITPTGVLPKYLMYQFQAPFLQRHFEKHARGTAQKGVYLNTLGQTPILVAPLGQQAYIVAEIEKQFSRLDGAVANLKRVKANLKRYKAAVLKAAVEGKLTEDWRKQHPNVEPASKLLERILAERQAKMKQGMSAELPIPGVASNGWVSVRVGEICKIVDGDRGSDYPKKSDFHDAGYCLFLSTKNVRPNGFLFEDNQFIPKEKHEQLRKGTLERGDIVFTSRGTVGNIARYGKEVTYECVRINSGMFILRGFSELLDEMFFEWYLRSAAIRNQIDRLKSGTAQPQLPIREFRSFEILFPSKPEQLEVVKEVERHLSVIDELEASVEANLTRANRLRQSVLTIAFSGQLSAVTPFSARSSINHA